MILILDDIKILNNLSMENDCVFGKPDTIIDFSTIAKRIMDGQTLEKEMKNLNQLVNWNDNKIVENCLNSLRQMHLDPKQFSYGNIISPALMLLKKDKSPSDHFSSYFYGFVIFTNNIKTFFEFGERCPVVFINMGQIEYYYIDLIYRQYLRRFLNEEYYRISEENNKYSSELKVADEMTKLLGTVLLQHCQHSSSF
jgi:hypothetical protein